MIKNISHMVLLPPMVKIIVDVDVFCLWVYQCCY